jgi:hypothetical protein
VALTVEELADIMNYLEESEASLGIDIGMLQMDPRLKMYVPLYEARKAQVRGMIARIEEEMGREKADT